MNNGLNSTEHLTYDNSDYIAWVPCISGTLDFKYAEASLAMSKTARTSNIELSDEKRLIVLSSSFDWADRPQADADGKFRIIVLAESGESCNGQVHIVPVDTPKIEYHLNQTLDQFYSSNALVEESLVKQAYGEPSATADLKKAKLKLTHDLHHLEDYLDLCSHIEPEFYSVKFQIQSNGITHLTYDEPDDTPSEKSDKYTIIRQSFYYLKYSLHQHKHHGGDDDALSTIHLRTGEKEHSGQSLIEPLLQGLIANKRLVTLNNLYVFKHKGIVSYVSALLDACKDSNIIDEKYKKSACNRLTNINDSYDAMAESHKEKRKNKLDSQQHARASTAILLAIAGLVILSLFRAYSNDITAPEKPLNIASNENFSIFFKVNDVNLDPNQTSISKLGKALYTSIKTNVEYTLITLIGGLFMIFWALYFMYEKHTFNFKVGKISIPLTPDLRRKGFISIKSQSLLGRYTGLSVKSEARIITLLMVVLFASLSVYFY